LQKLRQALIFITDACNLKCKHCLPSDAMIVSIRDGVREIGSFVDNYFPSNSVVSHKGFSDVSDTLKHDFDGNLVVLKANYSQPLELTPEHFVFVRDKEFIGQRMASEIKVGNEVFLPKPPTNPLAPKELLMSEVCSDLKICFKAQFDLSKMRTIERMRKEGKTYREISQVIGFTPSYTRKAGKMIERKKTAKIYDFSIISGEVKFNQFLAPLARNPVPEKIKIDAKLARFLGLFVAEGCISKSKNRNLSTSVRLSFNAKKEQHLAAESKMFFKDIFGLEAAIRQNNSAVNVDLTNSALGCFFEKMCGKGAHNKFVHPLILFNSNPEIRKAFLEGYLAGDGCVTSHNGGRTRVVACNTVSKKLAFGLQQLMLSLRILPTICRREQPSSSIRGRKIKSTTAWYLYYPLVEKRKSEYDPKLNGWWVKVLKVGLKPYKGAVYDLTVYPHHLFSANAIEVHNCYNATIRTTTTINYSQLVKIFDLLKLEGVKDVCLLGGEPTLHPKFAEVVHYASKTFRFVTIQTNGTTGFDWTQFYEKNIGVLVSIESIYSIEDEAIRGKPEFVDLLIKARTKGANLGELKEWLSNKANQAHYSKAWACLSSLPKHLHPTLRITIFRDNHALETSIYAWKHGYNVIAAPYKVFGEGANNKHLQAPSKEQMRELYVTLKKLGYKNPRIKIVVEEPMFNAMNEVEIDAHGKMFKQFQTICPAATFRLSILPSLTVVPCHFLGEESSMGNILTDDFETIKLNLQNWVDKCNSKPLKPGCEKCFAFKYCFGGCKLDSLGETRGSCDSCCVPTMYG
jgi:radical SAM protein with 4Fe4S-binding SPASM domain